MDYNLLKKEQSNSILNKMFHNYSFLLNKWCSSFPVVCNIASAVFWFETKCIFAFISAILIFESSEVRHKVIFESMIVKRFLSVVFYPLILIFVGIGKKDNYSRLTGHSKTEGKWKHKSMLESCTLG